MLKVFKMFSKIRISVSSLMEIIGLGMIAYGIGVFSIPISAIVCGVLLIIAGGLTA
jgi:hypothetical protein